MRSGYMYLVLGVLVLFILGYPQVTSHIGHINMAECGWQVLRFCFVHTKATVGTSTILILGILFWRSNLPQHNPRHFA